jgi:DNA-directed RNA polymerase subunit RPC12/RpoP
MTLGAAAAAQVRMIVYCKECQHQVEPDPAETVARCGAETSVPDWRERLVCSKCGSREIDMVVTGAKRRPAWRRSDAIPGLPSFLAPLEHAEAPRD